MTATRDPAIAAFDGRAICDHAIRHHLGFISIQVDTLAPIKDADANTTVQVAAEDWQAWLNTVGILHAAQPDRSASGLRHVTVLARTQSPSGPATFTLLSVMTADQITEHAPYLEQATRQETSA
jgi:hypothetical protein